MTMLGDTVATRRGFLKGAAAAAAAAAVRHPAGAWAETRPLETVRLSAKTVAVRGPDANAVAAAGGDGVILVDGGSENWSPALLATVDQTFASQPVRALFNTHWHREQTGSNVALGRRGAKIIAHENTKLWLGA